MGEKLNFQTLISSGRLLFPCIILFFILVLVAQFCGPSLTTAKDSILADGIAKKYWETDPECKICIEKDWFVSNFYLKTNEKLIYLGNGYVVRGIQFLPIPSEVSRDFRGKCERLK